MGIPLRLLMIEDSEDDATLLLRELQRGGYDVVHERVDTSAAMVSAVDSQKWDLVISDYSMPHFSGMEALHGLRSIGFTAPFIFVSGTIGEETAVSALKDGAQDYLMKTNLKRLVPAVQRELREAEERRERTRLGREVHQLQKFEAIGRLAGGIAHDFNNVICAILGWAELCHQDAEPGTQLHERLKKIMDQTNRAGALTSQLLSFARQQFLQPRRIDLNAHISHSTNLLEGVVGENIAITIRAAPDLHVTMADAGQIDQVIMNLCLNARDAMPNGGQLILSTANVEIEEEYSSRVGNAPPGSYVLLSVSDTGNGIGAEMIEQIFEPFFPTRETDSGTGLGLATVYGIVKQHGGFVNVESESGVGTTFRVYLPATSGDSDLADSQDGDKPLNGTETVLLAEDHDGLRESAVQMLENLGYLVLPAHDGLEALRLFKGNVTQIDLAILDVVMPELSGTDLYSQIVSIRPDLPVIFTTGYASRMPSLTSMFERGAMFLQKPYVQRTIGRKIREALDRARPVLAHRDSNKSA
jgi:two-component system cell cycle sensor histidine kinase/response regulator CckA